MKPSNETGEAPVVRSSDVLGEPWTDDDLWDARHILSAVCEGVDVMLTAERMDELSKRGLVYDITRLPGRGRYAGRFTFKWGDKLEELVRAAQDAGVYSPNIEVSERRAADVKQQPGDAPGASLH